MTEQLAITLAAATVGFASAIFFCIGNASNTSEKILIQATPFWDFSEPLASSLAAQRSEYVVGALLLLASFVLQIAAALMSSTTLVNLPQYLHIWPVFVLVVLVLTLTVAAVAARLLYAHTMRKILRLEVARREEDERVAKS
ncbi:MAG: hypothetical protein R3E36_03675 [Nitrosomonas sp.]|nr:hypothetical protein [Nitrosomonas sp.]MDR4519689.1 hypothetical protein [Nitrosomonas sp.]